jgi:hypothetical protein
MRTALFFLGFLFLGNCKEADNWGICNTWQTWGPSEFTTHACKPTTVGVHAVHVICASSEQIRGKVHFTTSLSECDTIPSDAGTYNSGNYMYIQAGSYDTRFTDSYICVHVETLSTTPSSAVNCVIIADQSSTDECKSNFPLHDSCDTCCPTPQACDSCCPSTSGCPQCDSCCPTPQACDSCCPSTSGCPRCDSCCPIPPMCDSCCSSTSQECPQCDSCCQNKGHDINSCIADFNLHSSCESCCPPAPFCNSASHVKPFWCLC